MSNKKSNANTTLFSGKGFFSENKFLVLGGAFLIAVVVLAGFLFTTSPGGDMAGRFTHKAFFEGASVEFLGAPTNSIFDEGEEVSMYARAGSSLGMHAATFNINYDPNVLSLTKVHAYAGSLQDHIKFDSENSIPILIKMDDVNKPHTFKNGDNMVRFDFKVVGKSGASNDVSITNLVVSTQENNKQVTTFSQGDNKFKETISIVGACTDSDGGIEASVPGICVDSVSTYLDGCSNGKTEEYYCGSGNKCKNRVIACVGESQCNLIKEGDHEKVGVCGPGVKKQCTDTDKSTLDPYTAGTVTAFYYGEKTVKEDACADTSNLNEYYCANDMLQTVLIPCAEDMRCLSGKCMKPYCGDVGGSEEGPDFVANSLDITPTEICYAGFTDLITERKYNCDNADWNLDDAVNAPDITFAELFSADKVELHNDCFEGGAISICGNGEYEPGEECDDKNKDNDDGCSSECKLESEKEADILKVHDVEKLSELCGDGIVLAKAGEECDDSNNVNTDACLDTCKLNVCGDGVLLTDVEACDDGNVDDGDGCSSECKLIAECGDTITQTTVLTSDVAATGKGDNACLTIAGDGKSELTLDCKGYKITGNGAGIGVLVDGDDIVGEKGDIKSITVKNCKISNFDTGVKVVGTKDQYFIQPKIYTNTITDSVYGISFSATGEDASVNSNIIQDNVYGVYAEPIDDGYLGMQKNTIKNNEEYGVYYNWADGEYGRFVSNTVTGNKIGIKMEGVHFDQKSFTGNKLCGNTITDVSCPKFSDFSKPETQINNVFTTIDGTCEEDSKWPAKDTHYTECPLNLPDGFEYYTGLWKYERADGKCGKDVDEKWEVRMINTLVAGAFGENSYVLGAAPKNCVVSITKTFEVDKPGGKVLSWWLRSGHANVKHNLDMYVNDELFKSVPGSSSRLYWHPFRETFADDVTSPVKLKFVTSAGLANVATGYIDEIEIGTESIQEAADETECAGDWEEDNPCAYTYDGKWSTRGLALKEAGVRHTATVTETYKKPEGATRASVWRVKAGSEYEVDLVLTPACFNNHDTIKVKAELISDDNFAKVYFYCWGSNEWVKIGTRNNYRGFTEDKMNWFIAD